LVFLFATAVSRAQHNCAGTHTHADRCDTAAGRCAGSSVGQGRWSGGGWGWAAVAQRWLVCAPAANNHTDLKVKVWQTRAGRQASACMTTRGVLRHGRGYKGAGQTLRGWLSGRPSKRIQLKVRQAAAQWENRTPKPGAALAFGWRGRGGAPPACGGAAAAAVAPPPGRRRCRRSRHIWRGPCKRKQKRYLTLPPGDSPATSQAAASLPSSHVSSP